MNLQIKTDDNQIVCHLHKRLDTNIAYQLEPTIDQATHPGKKLIFDFTKVEYISSSFLRICVKKYKELGPDQFWIQHPTPDIKRVFKIAGLMDLIRE